MACSSHAIMRERRRMAVRQEFELCLKRRVGAFDVDINCGNLTMVTLVLP